MIDFDIRWDGYEDLNRYIERVSDGLANLDPLIAAIKRIMLADNVRGRQQGIDFEGKPLVPIAKSTWHGRAGSGPPMTPRGAGSRVVAGMDVIVFKEGEDWLIGIVYDDAPWLKFHLAGPDHAKHLPIRHIVGVTPEGQQEITQAVHDYVYDLLYGTD